MLALSRGHVQEWDIFLTGWVPAHSPSRLLQAEGYRTGHELLLTTSTHPSPPSLLQVVVDVSRLEARMADIDGSVTITRRVPPPRPLIMASAASSAAVHRAGERQSLAPVELQEPLAPPVRLFFRSADLGVKWILQVGCFDLF